MKNQLDDFRKQIDSIDRSIVNLLAERMEVVSKVGEFKKKNKLPARDNSRWQQVIQSKNGYLKKIWEIIHDEALKVEKQIL